MIVTMGLAATFLAAVAMGLSLAHALEFPGKMRLDRDQYYTVQAIYYPGFTWGGFAEPLAILATLALALLTPSGPMLWLILLALAALVLTQLVFWWRVQPVNRQWLRALHLSGAAGRFFGTDHGTEEPSDWTKLRDRWEMGHLARALCSTLAFLCLLIALPGMP
jgi:hypothetical protein